MLLAYTYFLKPLASRPELCIVAEKPDQFSIPVRASALCETDCAVIRLSQQEAIKVSIDPHDQGFIVDPVQPAKLFLTPTYPDRPGINVKKIKIVKIGEDEFRTFFTQETKDQSWKEWKPNEMQ